MTGADRSRHPPWLSPTVGAAAAAAEVKPCLASRLAFFEARLASRCSGLCCWCFWKNMPQALQHSRPALAARQTHVEVVPQLAHICVQHSPHTTAQGVVRTAWRENLPRNARRLAGVHQQPGEPHWPVRRCVSPERLTRCRLLVGSPARRPLGSAHTL